MNDYLKVYTPRSTYYLKKSDISVVVFKNRGSLRFLRVNNSKGNTMMQLSYNPAATEDVQKDIEVLHAIKDFMEKFKEFSKDDDL